jgi:adenosine deaminase
MKRLARTGMEHNFLPGDSLWAKPDKFEEVNAACRGEELGGAKPSDGCKRFLDGSEKAAAQWEQERRFREFESRY